MSPCLYSFIFGLMLFYTVCTLFCDSDPVCIVNHTLHMFNKLQVKSTLWLLGWFCYLLHCLKISKKWVRLYLHWQLLTHVAQTPRSQTLIVIRVAQSCDPLPSTFPTINHCHGAYKGGGLCNAKQIKTRPCCLKLILKRSILTIVSWQTFKKHIISDIYNFSIICLF